MGKLWPYYLPSLQLAPELAQKQAGQLMEDIRYFSVQFAIDFIGQNDIQMKDGEPMDVTAKVVSSMCDCIMARLGDHEEIEVDLLR
jgi:hypothetical protein